MAIFGNGINHQIKLGIKLGIRLKRLASICLFPLALGVTLFLGLGGCDRAKLTPGNDPLPVVAPLRTSQLPDWIEDISPTGEAKPTDQIRIRFKTPLTPVESLESDDLKGLLQKFEVLPPLPGQFRFLTPRMVGFQADQALPKATRIKITLKSGLSDRHNHRLSQDFEWTFNTESIKITDLPGADQGDEPFELKPVLKFTSNVELNSGSLGDHLSLTPVDAKTDPKTAIPLQISRLEDPKPSAAAPGDRPETQFDPSAKTWKYTATPQQDLSKDTRYRFAIAPGVRPVGGNLASETLFATQIKTYAPLAFKQITPVGLPDAGGAAGRFINGAPSLQFNNGLEVASATANIQLAPAPQAAIAPLRIYEGESSVNVNPWALAPATTYTIKIKGDLKDKYGQTLGKPLTVTYKTGDVSPDLWVPSGFNIFPAAVGQTSAQAGPGATTQPETATSPQATSAPKTPEVKTPGIKTPETKPAAPLQLNISTVNLSSYKAAFAEVSPTDLVFTDTAYPQDNGVNLLPAPSAWKSTPVAAETNQSIDSVIPVQKQLGKPTGLLAYGVQIGTNSYTDNKPHRGRDPIYGMVQLTNLGVFAQWFPDSGLVRVHHLDTGAAVPNVSIQIYLSKLRTKSLLPPSPCATGTTNSAGLWEIDRAALQRCISKSSGGFAKPPELLVIAQEKADWAFTRTYEYSGAYEYGLDAGWTDGKPESRGIIFSDRQLYQPGEIAYFTTAAYYLQNGSLKQDKQVPYSLTLKDPNGQLRTLPAQTTNAFGTFSFNLPLDKAQPLGYYTLTAKNEAGVAITGEFRIAEFKPPNFKVALALEGGRPVNPAASNAPSPSQNPESKPQSLVALPQDKLTAKTQSNYLFGAPLAGGQAQYFVTRKKTEFAPAQWPEFTFGRQWFWPEQAPTIASDVLQTTQVIDAKGNSSEAVTVDAELPYPLLYRVDAQVSDVSNLSVADSQEFVALPSDRLIGLKTDFVATAAQAFPVSVMVTDPAGTAIARQKIRVELQQMSYSRIARVVEGSSVDQNQVEYKTVATADVESDNTAVIAQLTPTTSGSYRIRANFADAKTDATATETQIWVTGSESVGWGDRYSNNRLEVKLDKASYKPGAIATAIIQSPYPEGELYFAVIRHKTLYWISQKVQGGAPKVQFRVTSDMVPNAAVQAVLVRQGQPVQQTAPGSLDKLVKTGFAPFQTNLDDQYLTVTANATPTLKPGEEQSLQFSLKNPQGKPVKGQLTVMVVNEAVLQLSGYRPPDLVKTVYAEQPITTRLSDNRPDVVLQPLASPLDKGWGYGGGLSSGASNTRARSNFQAAAYYNGSLPTDATGTATARFKLPDDLTTWRVMVVATDGDLHFGNGETSFVTTKPLIANPLLPQFARPGDRLQIGLAVTNTTGQSGNLAINGSVTNPIQFDNNSGSLQSAIESGTRAFRFPIVANGVGDTEIQFTTQLNNESDAFKIPLSIRPLEITEQVIESGSTKNQAKIPLNIDNKVANDLGGLDISLASSLIPTLALPAQQVLDDNELPFLEPVASQLAIAANLQLLTQTYGQTFAGIKPAEQASAAIAQLLKLQLPDGGFASFPGQTTADPFVTPYAAQSLARAIRAFGTADTLAPAPDSLMPPLKTYLKKLLADPGQSEFCKDLACKQRVRIDTLIALADLGDRRNDFIADLYDQRQKLDRLSQLKFARYLSQTPNWEKEGQQMAQDLLKSVYETGRSATIQPASQPDSNPAPDWQWLNSPAIDQAQTLRLSVSQKSRIDLIGKLVQGLLDQRRHGTWQGSYATAQALTALVEYSTRQPIPPNFQATAKLAGKSLASAQFQGYRTPSTMVKVPIADLPRDRHDLILQKSGRGLLHYLVAYRYRLQGNPPGRLNGLRITRLIRPANQDKVLYRTGLYAKEALTVPTGQVWDIGLEVITDHPVDHVVITDPLPAGLEAVDNSFQTSTSYYQAQTDNWELAFKTMHKDRIVAFGDRLKPGVYTLHYLVRSVTPGTFLYPGAEAHLQYAPEEFGRSAATTLVVKE
jgi:alpha-2-macroglobulin